MAERVDPLLTEREAARRLALSVKTLRRWRWSGDGPSFIKIGRAVRYDPLELSAYIERGIRRSTSDPGPGGVASNCGNSRSRSTSGNV